MYANVKQGVSQGILSRQRLPRFPDTQAELLRITGITFSHATTCQNAATSITSLLGNITLTAVGVTSFRTPVKGLPEYGAYIPAGQVGRFTGAVPAATYPGASSFMFMCYYSYLGSGHAANRLGYSLYDAADGSDILALLPGYADTHYEARMTDNVNAKSFLAPPVPGDKIARGHVFLYDSTDGNIYHCITGMPVITAPMGAWLGSGVVGAPALALGAWPGVASTDINVRYAAMAIGAQLDGFGASIPAMLRKLGWQ